jgi:hypothetical protein
VFLFSRCSSDSFLVVFQILSCFRNLLWYVSASETFGRYKTREIRNFNQSSITKLGVRETFFCGDILWLCFSLFFRFLFKKLFLVCFQAVNSDSFFFNGYASTPILSFLVFPHFVIFFFRVVVNPDFFSKKLGGIKFCCFEVVIKNNGQNSCFYFGNTNIASNPMFPILFCCSGPFIVSLVLELRILSN